MDLTATIRREFMRVIRSFAQGKSLTLVPENMMVPQPEGPYLEAWLLPADNAVGTLNAPRQQGIFQVNIYTTADEGAGAADKLAAEVMALFPRGRVLGVVALGKYPNRSKGMMLNGRYAVTVSVAYFAIG